MLEMAMALCAFIANSMSSIIPVHAFGVLCSCLVVANFLILIFMFPTQIVAWYQYIKPLEQNCFDKLCKKKEHRKKRVSQLNETHEEEFSMHTSRTLHSIPIVQHLHFLQIFFKDKWLEIVGKFKWVFIAFGFIFIGIGAYGTSQLSPLSKFESFFFSDHKLVKRYTWLDNYVNGEFLGAVKVSNAKQKILVFFVCVFSNVCVCVCVCVIVCVCLCAKNKPKVLQK